MKKTRVMSTIAMVCFILTLVWQVVNEVLYFVRAFKHSYGGAIIARVFFLGTLPTIVGIVLLIISMKKAKTGINPPQYKLGFFLIAGAELLGIIIKFITSKGNMSNSIDSVIRTLILICAYLLVAFDATLLKKNKAMGIIGAVIIIAISFIFSFYRSFEFFKDMPSSFLSGEEALNYYYSLFRFLSYYTMLQFLGIGALLYAIGRQSKDSEQLPPASPNGGGYQQQINNPY